MSKVASDRQISSDVVIVGASIAGCTAARLYAQAGLSVTLVERHSDPGAYKHLCGHFIQPSATPVIERIGLAPLIEAAGGVRNGADVRTPWGTIAHRVGDERPLQGFSIRRSRLDPMLRDLATSTPGVTYLGGHTVTSLLDGGGIRARDTNGSEVEVRARLVVGADGRNSTVAELAGAEATKSENARFCYMAYFTGVDLGTDAPAKLWIQGPDVAIGAHNEDGVTILALFLSKDRLASFKGNRDTAFLEVFRALPDAPTISGEQVSKLVGYTDYPVVDRRPVQRGDVVLVGDAAHSADPVWAVGCGWAFQTAGWLVDSTSHALREGSSLAPALRHYARTRRKHIGGHQRFLALGARTLKPNPVQKALMSAAARDRRIASRFHAFAGRSVPVRRFMNPAVIARSVWVNARAKDDVPSAPGPAVAQAR